MLEERLPEFLEFLRSRRYCAKAVDRSRRVAGAFLGYLAERIRGPEDLEPRHARAYLLLVARRFRQRRGRPIGQGLKEATRAALHLLLRYLAERGLRPPAAPPRRRDLTGVPGYEEVLRAYESFLSTHRGLAPATIVGYVDEAARLCRARGPRAAASWDAVSPSFLYDCLVARAEGRGDRSRRIAYSALRGFFRFLRLTERCERNLESCFIRYRVQPRVRLPTTLSTEEIYRVFDALRDVSPRSLRHRAVLFLAALHGLRLGEADLARLREVAGSDELEP